jgi:hypothetical protein
MDVSGRGWRSDAAVMLSATSCDSVDVDVDAMIV